MKAILLSLLLLTTLGIGCKAIDTNTKFCDDGSVRYQSSDYKVTDIWQVLDWCSSDNPAEWLNGNLWLQKISDGVYGK